MGILDIPAGERVYLDTNIFIYALEGYPAYQQDLTKLFGAIDQGQISAITSELTLAEILVKPFMDRNLERQQVYQQAIRNSGGLAVVPISRLILVEAARLRATGKFRLPDAIHGATALLAQCSLLLTNDRHFQQLSGLEVRSIS